ncbi:MAG: geranylgeranylglycerol-phosphate geranylgeranyltransferase [Flavobacteriaceae bacterium]|nr:geranylgeranylglycerol-phosphate geranylgeranyltransferase [Flavobacteriaceae bacterium]
MSSKVAKNSFLKLLALFTVIRGYNIAALVAAMYLTAYFIFDKDATLHQFFSDIKLHLIVLASAFTVSAGFIINNFYDLDKDAIARPLYVYISRFISQNFKLNVYLVFCVIALLFAVWASWRVGIFFMIYQILVWLYSHKLSRITFIQNLFYVILSLMPFVALLLYYNNFSYVIFYHGLFLSMILLIMDISKDLVSYRADLIYNYKTLPVTVGKKKTKIILNILFILSILWTIFMTQVEAVGHMKYYFAATAIALLFLSIIIWWIENKWQYNLYYLSLKLMLGLGIMSIAWIGINPLNLQKFFPLN